jgi:hypothetical protein
VTRCKFVCTAVTKRQYNVWPTDGSGPSVPGFVHEAEFLPVMDSTPENKAFFASTPTGSCKIGTIRDDIFIPGKSYYFDISEVPVPVVEAIAAEPAQS